MKAGLPIGFEICCLCWEGQRQLDDTASKRYVNVRGVPLMFITFVWCVCVCVSPFPHGRLIFSADYVMTQRLCAVIVSAWLLPRPREDVMRLILSILYEFLCSVPFFISSPPSGSVRSLHPSGVTGWGWLERKDGGKAK